MNGSRRQVSLAQFLANVIDQELHRNPDADAGEIAHALVAAGVVERPRKARAWYRSLGLGRVAIRQGES